MPFDARALTALDFPRIREALAERSSTSLGVERARGLSPSGDPGRIARELDEVEDALFGVSLSLGGIQDIRELHARTQDGRGLSGQELLTAAYSLDGAMTVKRAINANSRGPLREVALGLGEHGSAAPPARPRRAPAARHPSPPPWFTPDCCHGRGPSGLVLGSTQTSAPSSVSACGP